MLVRWRRAMQAAPALAAAMRDGGRPYSPLSLNPKVVETALSNCSSDVVALSLFIWCARQSNYFHSPKSFDLIIPAVDRMRRRFGSVSGILGELEIAGCRKKPQIFLILMRIFRRGEMHRLVIEAFDEMSANNYVPNVFARNIALDSLFKVGSIKAAFDFFEETRYPNFLTFKVVITNLCDLDNWSGARMVIRIMIRRRIVPDDGTLSRILIFLHGKGRLKELLQVVGFLIVSGKQLSVSEWTILIHTLCKLYGAEYGSPLLGKMLNSGCPPTVITYTVIIKGFLESQCPDKAFSLLDFMMSNGFDPDLVLCNVLIDFLCKSKRFDDAIELILCLREWNLKPDFYTLPSLMSILCAYRRIDLIPKLIDALDIRVDLVACNSLMHILCKAGLPSNAVEFYDTVVDSGYKPDNYSFSTLLSGLCRSGRVDDAIRVYNGILLSGNSIDACVHTVVLNGLVRGGRTHTAITLFRKAVSGNFCLDMVLYRALVYGMLRGRGSEEAFSLLYEMKQLGWDLGVPAYEMMIRGLLKSGKFSVVNRLLKIIADSGGTTLKSIQHCDKD